MAVERVGLSGAHLAEKLVVLMVGEQVGMMDLNLVVAKEIYMAEY